MTIIVRDLIEGIFIFPSYPSAVVEVRMSSVMLN